MNLEEQKHFHCWCTVTLRCCTSTFLDYFPKAGLCDLHFLSVCICNPCIKFLYAWTALYETYNVYHGKWTHLNGILHKFLPSVCVSLCVFLLLLHGNGSIKCFFPFGTRQYLLKYIPTATNTHNSGRLVGYVIFSVVFFFVKGESVYVSVHPPAIDR